MLNGMISKLHPQNTGSYPKLFEFPLMAGRKMNEGFSQGLNEQGMQVSEMTIEQGLSQAIAGNSTKFNAKM